MMLSWVQADRIDSTELKRLVYQVRSITNGGYDRYDQNEDMIIRLLDKILVLSKKEKEWYLYFDALYCMLYMLKRGGNHKKILKYAEIYYKDSACYMDREIPNYPNTDMAETNTYCCSNIFDAYIGYYQINDEKMESFMKMYEETVYKYGGQVHYYHDEMRLAVLYRDKERLRRAKSNFEKYEVLNCYICMHLPYFPYYLLNNDMESAEEFIDTILQKRIPKKHQWCYERCQNSRAGALYCDILDHCLAIGDAKSFCHIYKKYWSQVAKRLKLEDGRSNIRISIFFCALTGDFSELEADLKEAEQTVQTIGKCSTDTAIHRFLKWWIYFLLLEKNGGKEVRLSLPGKENQSKVEETGNLSNRENQISTKEAAAYFEEKADEYGALFEAARKQYDYQLMKNTYLECAANISGFVLTAPCD